MKTKIETKTTPNLQGCGCKKTQTTTIMTETNEAVVETKTTTMTGANEAAVKTKTTTTTEANEAAVETKTKTTPKLQGCGLTGYTSPHNGKKTRIMDTARTMETTTLLLRDLIFMFSPKTQPPLTSCDSKSQIKK